MTSVHPPLCPGSILYELHVVHYSLWPHGSEETCPLRAWEVSLALMKIWSSHGPLKSEVIKTRFFLFVCLVVVYLEITISQKLNRFLTNLLPSSCMCQKPRSKIFPRHNSHMFYLSASLSPY